MRESEVGQNNYCPEGNASSQHRGHSRSSGCSKYRFSKGGEPPPVYFKVHESCLQLNRHELTCKEQKCKEMKGHEWK